MKSHLVGLFSGLFIIYYALTNTGKDSKAYFDLMSVIIVMGGSLSVSLMTNGLRETLKICSLFFKVFATDKYDNVMITKEIVSLSKKQYFGTLNYNNIPEGTYHPFIMDGIRLLHNKFDKDKLKNIMVNQLRQRADHQEKMVERIEILAKYPPAFGMMGTIIGLVAVLKQINSPDNMSSIGPSMAVALVTTLYGILISNYILHPIADNLLSRNNVDLKIRQLVAEGIILISENNDPVYVREALFSFLTPEERTDFGKDGEVGQMQEERAA